MYENCGMYIMKIMEPILQLMEQTFNAVLITFNSLWLKSSLWRIARSIWCRTFSSCLAVDECDRVVGLHSEKVHFQFFHLCVKWIIWKERNYQTVKAIEQPMVVVKLSLSAHFVRLDGCYGWSFLL
nr:uncharacterized protein LOC111989406 [Quercus suber]